MNWKSNSARWLIGAYIGVLGIIGAQRDRMWANDLSLQEMIRQTDFAAGAVGGLRDRSSDREKPALQLPADLTVMIASNQSSAVVQSVVTATDNCPGVRVIATPKVIAPAKQVRVVPVNKK